VEGVTDDIKKERIGKWGNGLEEMRAEILALYTGTHFYDEICASGTLGEWPKLVPKEKIFELMLQEVAGCGWKRWRSTPIDSEEVKQAHALADNGIMYYLIDHSNGLLQLKQESVEIDGKNLDVLRLVTSDINAILPIIEKMAIDVQKLSSHANFDDINAFMLKYAVSTRNPKFGGIVRQMNEVLTQGISIKVQVFPEWSHENDNISATIPTDPIAASLKIWKLAHQ